jgi:hypothetical protein
VVDFEEGRSLFEKIGFKQEPEEQLHRIVDVTTPQSLHWLIRDKVIAEAEPLSPTGNDGVSTEDEAHELLPETE